MRVRTVGLAALGALSFAVAAYAWVFFTILRHSVPVTELSAVTDRWGALYVHATTAALALALGPFQFSRRLRARRPALHRAIGKAYLAIGVGVGGLSGLYLALQADGGLASRAGFTGLAVAWLATGALAYATARRREFDAHRRWVVRSFALTFAAVMLRIYMGASGALGVPFDAAYPVVAWACWVPNVAVVEAWMRWRGPRWRPAVALA